MRGGESIRLPVILSDAVDMGLFGFDIEYPADLLVYQGFSRGVLARHYGGFTVDQLGKGWLRVEAGDPGEPKIRASLGSLVLLHFRVKKGGEAPGAIRLTNLTGDLYPVSTREGTCLRLGETQDEVKIVRLGRAARSKEGYRLVPIRLSEGFEIKAVGLQLAFDPENMQFLGLRPGNLAGDFISLDAREKRPGMIRVGGFAASGRQERGAGVLCYLVFTPPTEGNGNLEIRRLFDDLSGFVIQ
jgi:hypothetical protein